MPSPARTPAHLMSFITNLDMVLARLRAASSTQCRTAAGSHGGMNVCAGFEQVQLCRGIAVPVSAVPVCTLANTRGGMEMTRYSCRQRRDGGRCGGICHAASGSAASACCLCAPAQRRDPGSP